MEYLETWLYGDGPLIYNLGALFHPDEFLACIVQMYARKHSVAVDGLTLMTIPVKNVDDFPIDKAPEEGVYIDKLALEGAKWDSEQGRLIDCSANDLLDYLPVMHLVPTEVENPYDLSITYECPVYRTRIRKTGPLDLPNCVMSYWLPTKENPVQWVRRSVAAFITP
jgi:hypothetical protein